MRIRINEIERCEFIVAILYTFRFLLKMTVGNDGNYDAFYLLALFATVYVFFQQSKKFFLNIWCVLLLVIIWGLTNIGGTIEVSTLKSCIFIAKMSICFYLFIFVCDKIEDFDIQAFIDYSTFFLSIQTILALMQRGSECFWRTADGRMELFFLEPSELGVFVGILILIQLFLIKENKTLKRHLINIVILCTILVLSSSLSGILYTVASSTIYLVFDKNNKRGISKKQLCFLIVAIVGITVLLSTDNYVSNRFFNALGGTDSSFNTRSSVPIQTAVSYFKNYGMFGFGFGNMNTARGLSFFGLKAKNYVVCAAYFLFAIEGGLVAIIAEILFTLYILFKSLKSGSAFHLALFVFVFFYMYLGGYTTNPVIWALYAVLCTEKSKILVGGRKVRKKWSLLL